MTVKGELEGMCVKLFGFMGGFGFGAGLEEGREGGGIGVEAGVGANEGVPDEDVEGVGVGVGWSGRVCLLVTDKCIVQGREIR